MFPINSPKIPIVLVLPWLKLHSPNITWNKNYIKFESSFCKQNCDPNLKINAIFAPPSSDFDKSIQTDSEDVENIDSGEGEFFDTNSETEEILGMETTTENLEMLPNLTTVALSTAPSVDKDTDFSLPP
ncbi:hypothetical protein AYI69_g10267 [Smittium culicis]|uniref:Uncharacterized protein n=1 Tax=Smittium culicis TaxID=133412 RepID=A0A1R1X6W6_9FUNG|nr:hypothetical protein AYI69_g10267 [Smittium culicis]